MMSQRYGGLICLRPNITGLDCLHDHAVTGPYGLIMLLDLFCIRFFFNFCCAMLCISAAIAVMRCPSVRHVRGSCQNE